MKVTHPVGTICERCGMTKGEVRRMQFECDTGMGHYGKHLWNKEIREVETQYFRQPPQTLLDKQDV